MAYGFQQQTPIFPQPNGNVYLIQNSLEVANVPTGAGVTIALCMAENLMYVKAIQNGQPAFLAFRLSPYTDTTPRVESSLESRIAALEKHILGGNKNVQQSVDTSTINDASQF